MQGNISDSDGLSALQGKDASSKVRFGIFFKGVYELPELVPGWPAQLGYGPSRRGMAFSVSLLWHLDGSLCMLRLAVR